MLIASQHQEYDHHYDFILGLNRAKSSKPSFWNNPFSWVTRLESISRVYALDDHALKQHKV